MARASYQHINPNLKCGCKAAPTKASKTKKIRLKNPNKASLSQNLSVKIQKPKRAKLHLKL